MTTCAICDVELFDDPHWHDALEANVCEQHCDNEGCLNLPGDGSVRDGTAGAATGEDGTLTRSAVVPVAGGSVR